ncbi:MAG: helix-turn-helix transcriptional regulator [Chloroflexi bacterium]|nr:MAG: helix-turn-helix transcriptional regulator [Chloroflexota bacterium]
MDGRAALAFALGALLGFALSRRILVRRPRPHDVLSGRQLEILRAVAAGKTTKVIAAEAGISETSVNTHIRRARRVLGVPTRAAAAAAVTGQTVATPASPRRSATRSSARTTSPTSSSNGMSMSWAPLSIISRLTARANALSFIFLRTEGASTSRTALDGFTRATAVTNPQSSSTA